MESLPIPWIPMLICGVTSLALGFVWYNPKVFGTAWMKSVDMTREDAQKGNMPLMFGLTFLLSMALAYFLGQWAPYHGPDEQTFSHGVVHALIGGAVFVIPALIINLLYELRSLVGILINVGFWIVLLCIMGGIMYAWPQPELPPPPPSEEGAMLLENIFSRLI